MVPSAFVRLERLPLTEGDEGEAVAVLQEALGAEPDGSFGPLTAEALAKEISKSGKAPRLIVQVNTGEEPQKGGILPSDADAFLDECRAELTMRDAELGARRTHVAEVDGAVAGFSTLDGAPPIGVVGMMFVDPDRIGSGIGRALMADLVERARVAGFVRLSIDADPNAEPFYLAQGAVRVGATPSGSIPGRVLPLLELDLAAGG